MITERILVSKDLAARLEARAAVEGVTPEELAVRLACQELPKLVAELIASDFPQNTATPEVPAPEVAQLTTRDVKHNR